MKGYDCNPAAARLKHSPKKKLSFYYYQFIINNNEVMKSNNQISNKVFK